MKFGDDDDDDEFNPNKLSANCLPNDIAIGISPTLPHASLIACTCSIFVCENSSVIMVFFYFH